VHSTFASLEAVFAADYAINRAAREEAPAMGRYRGDTYQSGGAFFFATLGAAEFHYRLARAVAGGAEIEEAESRAFLENAGVEERAPAAESAAALVARGDMFLATVRRFTPASGEMAEQFDQTNGRQSSARDLAWSYAAFITAIAARRAALGAPA
jgi:glucoamylase